MKKLLLSSIIMFGICGFVTAQKTTEAKSKKAEAVTAPAPSFTTATDAQKPAVATEKKNQTDAAVPASDANTKPVGKNTGTKTDEAKTTTVNDAGEVVTDEVAAKKKQDRAAIKAANAKKSKDN